MLASEAAAAVNVLYYCTSSEPASRMVEGCCSTQLRHYQSCLRLPPRVLSVCALCQYWAVKLRCGRGLGCLVIARHSLTRIYCARRGLPLASVPHVPNTAAVQTF